MLHVRPTLRLSRKPIAYQRLQPSRWNRNLLTLAIETSCDDTAVAILEKDDEGTTSTSIFPAHHDGTITTPQNRARARLLFNEKVTAPNTGLGGIHPLEALNSHQANLSALVSKAIRFLPDAKSTSTPTPGSKSEQSQVQRTITVESNPQNGTGKRITKQLPDFISVTRGPGMRSNLHCGLDTAKGLSVAWSIPLLGVHHMQAHALTPRLVDALTETDDKDPLPPTNNSIITTETEKHRQPTAFPFLTLLISGGHTLLLHSHTLTSHSILASTVDIAIGDALDKAGRLILPESIKSTTKDTAYAKHLSEFAFPDPTTYALWPVPERRADEIRKEENEWGWVMQAPFADTREIKFSFTSVESMVGKVMKRRMGGEVGREPKHEHERQESDSDHDVEMSLEERLALGRAAIGTAFEHLASRTVVALQSLQAAEQPISSLVVSGGVAANAFLRYFLRAMLDVRGFGHVRLVFPPPWLCTDNAAMIAWCGMEMYEAGYRSELGIGALRKWSMDREAADGGILGVGGWVKDNGS